MRSLPPPAINDVDVVYDDLARLDTKIGTLVARERLYFRERFAAFAAICGAPGDLASKFENDPQTGRTLRQLYKSPPRCGESLKARVRPELVEECAYCGGVVPPSTLDHFLEQRLFPELCLFPTNLVPVCRSCNPSARSVYGNRVTKINPYLTDVADRLRMVCILDGPVDIPKIVLKLDCAGLTDAERDLCIAHVSYLEVERHFKRFAAQEWRSLRNGIEGYSKADARRHVKTELRKVSSYSHNHWRVIFYEALNGLPHLIELMRRSRNGSG